jgi:IclR family transcriptional regulator, KDG regulon repressor
MKFPRVSALRRKLTTFRVRRYDVSQKGNMFHMRNTRASSANAVSPAIVNAMAILESFDIGVSSLSLSELSRKLGIPKASVFRNLNALEKCGYVVRSKKDGGYSLGVKVLDLARRFSQKDRFLTAGSVHTRELSRATGETSHLAILDGSDIVYVDVAEGSQTIRAVVGRGDRIPAHCVASGKAILAFSSRQVVMDFLARGLKSLTPRTFASPDALLEDLERTRRRGYATNVGEWVDDVAAVSVPIFGQQNEVVGAIGIAGPRLRLGNKMLVYLAAAISEQAERLSRELGGEGSASSTPERTPAVGYEKRRKRLVPAE